MASQDRLESLRQWFTDQGGFLNQEVKIEHNANRGVHCRAASDLAPESRICTVPHTLALSSLNALVDDNFPVFKNRGLSPQAIGYFYLMHQFVHKEKSFWKPYLDTLPAPTSEHRTPFWFDSDDLTWLDDTDVLFTYKARLAMHGGNYSTGTAMISQAGIDVTPYSWDLYKWAVTMFTSRSFSSRAIRPQDSKYWAAYKSGPDGRRQTVLLDMSRTSAEDLDFPILFPVLDIPNHSHDAKVDWTFDPGRFTMASTEGAKAGSEILNNYGPKSNDELLLGYGFCLRNNPNDKVLMTLKPPSDRLQHDIRDVQPGYFDTQGQWNSERATFGLKRISDHERSPADVFQELPAPLLELLAYMMRFERRLPFEFIDHPRQSLIDDTSTSRHYLPHITRMIVTSMAPKLQKLQSSTPDRPPSNGRQQQAQIYRISQIEILESVIGGLRGYLRSLLLTEFPHPQPLPSGPFITTLDGLLQLLGRHSVEAARSFVDGIVANAGTPDLNQLREAGWEEDVFVLLICYCQIAFGFELPEYCQGSTANVEAELLAQEMEQARDLLGLVATARQAVPAPESIWSSDQWTEQFVAQVGGRMLIHESFMMMVPAEGQEVARPVLYVLGSRASV
ncbi:Ribosomal lysine N-methyltransferase set10 [Pseudocercospora fuligena]|uniref:Ribosomal lysine N-methyltransferase set10 n=1 Tax=Pseudocercospora fuligena TaxID=685502 RepID=A0A8H6VIY3_9PEZI|nr:Ribosomal lysine N-methyltransferase set10 [Pseudocercospora fuligena]